MPGPREPILYRRSRIPGDLPAPEGPAARPPAGLDDPEVVRALEQAEEEKAKLLQELKRERRKSQVDVEIPSSIPPRRHHRPAWDYLGPGLGGTSLVGILVTIMKLWGDQKAEIQDLHTQVSQQVTKVDKAEKRAKRWEQYATDLKVADDCRFRQVCSALAHLDYGCSDTDYSTIQWSPPTGSWKRTGAPASRAVGECPKVPDPPKDDE